ncbi:MAG: hypothetical protein WA414_04175 [Acidobacteriaceae bacterium]
MGHKKQQSGAKIKAPAKHPSDQSSEGIGGREFGQATGPLQSEMASQNDGLTENSAARAPQNEKKAKLKGRKAA